MFGIGIQEFGLILVIALLVFGPKRLPELARMLGRGMGEFRRASNDLRQSLALDDLQNDLRRDLDSAQSLLKPDPTRAPRDDRTATGRPAQAGDDLPTASAETNRAGDPKMADSSSTPSSEAAASADVHQGELPLGNDHEHHPGSEPGHESDDDSEPNPEAATDRSERSDRPGG